MKCKKLQDPIRKDTYNNMTDPNDEGHMQSYNIVMIDRGKEKRDDAHQLCMTEEINHDGILN